MAYAAQIRGPNLQTHTGDEEPVATHATIDFAYATEADRSIDQTIGQFI